MSGDTIVAVLPALILMQLVQKAVPDRTSYSQWLIWSKWTSGMEGKCIVVYLKFILKLTENTGDVLYNLC